MGKKRMAIIGSEDEAQQRQKSGVKREQKKLREGKTAKAPGLGGGQRVVDTAAESLRELEIIQQKVAEAQSDKVEKKIKKTKFRSKNYQSAKAKVNSDQKYSLSDAVELLRNISYSKINDTVELHITLPEKGFTHSVDLPHSIGRSRRVALTDEITLAKIAAGKIDFDVLLASPSDMSKLVKYAKVLGPKGLMPNPKNGTIVANPVAVKPKFESGTSVDLKPDKDGLALHLVVGKLTMTNAELIANISAIIAAVFSKATKIILKSTMSPAIKLQI